METGATTMARPLTPPLGIAAWLRRPPPPRRPARPDRLGAAAAMLAAGASAERMGEMDDARLRYECVLLMAPGHARARQRLRALAGD